MTPLPPPPPPRLLLLLLLLLLLAAAAAGLVGTAPAKLALKTLESILSTSTPPEGAA